MSGANPSAAGADGAGGAGGAGDAGELDRAADGPPPFWSRWGRIYWFVAALLAAETLAFWLLSWWAA